MTHDNVTGIVVRPNLDAYYYGFYPTNCEQVDRLLGTVAYAGKCYHHTEDWEDKNSEGVSPIDNIQAAAIEAADTIATLRKQLENAREALQYCADAPFSGWTIAQAVAREALKGQS